MTIYNGTVMGHEHSLQKKDLANIRFQEEILRKEGKRGPSFIVGQAKSCGINSDSPAEAEESQVEAQQSGHHMSDERTGLAGVEVDPKPHSHQQGEQLTRHKVNLHRGM